MSKSAWLWWIYFSIMIVGLLFMPLANLNSVGGISDFFAIARTLSYVLGIIALYGFIKKKEIWTIKVWRVLFPIEALFGALGWINIVIPVANNIINNTTSFGIVILAIIFILVQFPYYWAYFYYAYKRENVKNDHESFNA